jgi:hypothetical protein
MCLGLQEEPNRYYQGNSQSIDNTIIVDIRLNLVLHGILGSGLFVVLSATCFALCPGKISRLLKLFLSTMKIVLAPDFSTDHRRPNFLVVECTRLSGRRPHRTQLRRYAWYIR